MDTKLSPADISEQLILLFSLDDSLKEEDVKEQHPQLYASSVEQYGNWKQALQKHGISRHKLIEREKFLLYWIMKKRFEVHGDEAIRHINIQPPELKERVNAAFKTIKGLRRHFYAWNEERVLFELRAHLLTGGSVEKLRTENADLYAAVKPFYKNIDELKEAYEDSFGISPVVEENVVRVSRPVESPYVESTPMEDILIDFLKEIDYFKGLENKSDIVEQVLSAKKISKSQVVDYVVEQFAISRKKGETFKEEDIKLHNPPMYYAFKQYFKSMREAFAELLSKVQ